MQFKLLFALVLLGTCVTQVTFAHPKNSGVDRNVIDELIEKAKEAIAKLKETVAQLVQEVLGKLEKLKQEIIDVAGPALDAFKQKLDELVAKAKEEIEIIKQKAQELGIDISGCLENNEADLKAIVDKLVQDEVNCVQQEIDNAMKIINEAMQIAFDAYQAVEDLPEKLKSCTSDSNPLDCVKNVIAEIVSLEKDLPAQIVQKVKEVQEFINGIQARLEICAGKQLVNAGIALGKIVADVAKCAAEKEN